ncbi:hypothetical protein [Frondihabitans cladoniiphilus]|uniref:Uncharacterized protein n=1 Tax=Frondihabitans cladoniiphilus TaxID=715785 RepID=A0ABP8VNM8_9MICO
MNGDAESPPFKPRVHIVSFAGDALHILGFIFLDDPDHEEPRQYNVEAIAGVQPLSVTPAGSQAHWPGGGLYLTEANRIARDLCKATFPHLESGS